LIHRKARQGGRGYEDCLMWQPISSAPYDSDLRLAILDHYGYAHALVFPCRRILGGWVNSATKKWVDIRPTHWKKWVEESESSGDIVPFPRSRNTV
jgi:hypothetical protein